MGDSRRERFDQMFLAANGRLPARPSDKESIKRRLYRRIEELPEDVKDVASILKGIVDAL